MVRAMIITAAAIFAKKAWQGTGQSHEECAVTTAPYSRFVEQSYRECVRIGNLYVFGYFAFLF